MVPIKIRAQIKDGKLCPNPECIELLREWLVANGGHDVELIVQSPKEAKTNQQLGYLWGHVIPKIAERIGYSKDDVYGMLKYKFLCFELECAGEDTCTIKSLSNMTKAEVSQFIDDSVEWGLSLGADIYPAQHYGG